MLSCPQLSVDQSPAIFLLHFFYWSFRGGNNHHRGFIKFLCRRSGKFFSWAFLVFLMKESNKRRREHPGKLMAKSHSQPFNLPSAQPLRNPLILNVAKCNLGEVKLERVGLRSSPFAVRDMRGGPLGSCRPLWGFVARVVLHCCFAC